MMHKNNYTSFHPFYEWPKVPGTMDLVIQDLLDACSNTQPQSAKKIKAGQMRQLENLLAIARDNAPYYAQMAAGFDLRAARDFSDIWKQVPTLSPDTIARAGAALILKNSLPDHGTRIDIPLPVPGMGTLKISATSFWQTVQNAMLARQFIDHGWNTKETLIELNEAAETSVTEINTGWGLPSARGKLISANLNLRTTQISHALKAYTEEYYIRMSGHLLDLVSELINSGKLPAPKGMMVFVGNNDQFEACKRIRKTIPSVIPVLSHPTFGIMAAGCPEHGKLHVQTENILIEKVGGDILVSCLHNFAMPLIRYAANLPIAIEKPCKCGRGSDVIRLTQ